MAFCGTEKTKDPSFLTKKKKTERPQWAPDFI